jgi:hypothetical protein
MKSTRVLWLGTAFCAALLCSFTVAGGAAWAQAAGPRGPVQCNDDFTKISAEAQKRGSAVGAALKAKVEHKQICALMNSFVAAETTVVKFLEENKTWCGIPDQVIAGAKANHEKSLKFRTVACTEEPKPKAPTLSDAIKAPSVDTSKNTKTGRGTFDTLTGNPLAR